jgi:hypothetical protein
MPKRLDNCFILSANISMEYEKSEVTSGFFYSNAEQREKMVAAERAITDERVQKVRNLKSSSRLNDSWTQDMLLRLVASLNSQKAAQRR